MRANCVSANQSAPANEELGLPERGKVETVWMHELEKLAAGLRLTAD